ncbi:MAG TPA: hypothetical protein VK203_06555 [Nostocaceae cyanobacterium]|nr:hypothetical protein [Nostocaceae cyanobacterium]
MPTTNPEYCISFFEKNTIDNCLESSLLEDREKITVFVIFFNTIFLSVSAIG